MKFPTLSQSRHFILVFRASSFKGFHVPQKIKDFDVHVSKYQVCLMENASLNFILVLVWHFFKPSNERRIKKPSFQTRLKRAPLYRQKSARKVCLFLKFNTLLRLNEAQVGRRSSFTRREYYNYGRGEQKSSIRLPCHLAHLNPVPVYSLLCHLTRCCARYTSLFHSTHGFVFTVR